MLETSDYTTCMSLNCFQESSPLPKAKKKKKLVESLKK